MADSDHVTGLETRATLESFFAESVFAGKDGTPPPLAVVMCDVVGLKDVNERDGFAAGDACLCHAAQRLRDSAGDADILARLGGDELVAVFTGPHASDAAERAVADLARGSEPPLRAAAIVQKQGENCRAIIDRLYAIVRRS